MTFCSRITCHMSGTVMDIMNRPGNDSEQASVAGVLHRLQLPRIIRDSHENIASQSATHGITLGLLSVTELILGKLN